jgi:two-component system response regulator FixJ
MIASSEDSTIAASRPTGADGSFPSNCLPGRVETEPNAQRFPFCGRSADLDQGLTPQAAHNCDWYKQVEAMIFILDDDQALRDSLRVLLECEGLPACEFASGREFLDRVRPEAGDCLLLDVHMPGLDGLDVLEALRRRGDAVPVIVVTGQPSPTARHRAAAAGAFAFVEKPYDADALLSLIRQAMEPRSPTALQ